MVRGCGKRGPTVVRPPVQKPKDKCVSPVWQCPWCGEVLEKYPCPYCGEGPSVIADEVDQSEFDEKVKEIIEQMKKDLSVWMYLRPSWDIHSGKDGEDETLP